MSNQEHIDKIIKYLLTARKIDADKINAFANVIRALSNVKEIVKQPNLIPKDDNQVYHDEPIDLSGVQNIQFGEEGKSHKVTLIPN